MKIGIFTPYSVEPMHPRTQMYIDFFRKKGFEAILVQSGKRRSKIHELMSKALINMFDFQSVFFLSHEIRKFDFIFIQDLKFLPLAIMARLRGKKVIYETLDNSVYIRVHNQQKNRFYPIIKLLTPVFSKIEKLISVLFTHRIIVNSLTLKARYGEHAELIYYSSPFERSSINNNPSNRAAFFFLGAITPDKGIKEILHLIDQYKIPVFLFGDCNDDVNRTILQSNPLVHWKGRISSGQLIKEIQIITRQYFLIGLSLIKPVHLSYATQEANKEIDYMTMGIPFVGNHRQTTKEKIQAGCGVFFDDPDGLSLLIKNEEYRKKKVSECIRYYQSIYSESQFIAGVSRVFHF